MYNTKFNLGSHCYRMLWRQKFKYLDKRELEKSWKICSLVAVKCTWSASIISGSQSCWWLRNESINWGKHYSLIAPFHMFFHLASSISYRQKSISASCTFALSPMAVVIVFVFFFPPHKAFFFKVLNIKYFNSDWKITCLSLSTYKWAAVLKVNELPLWPHHFKLISSVLYDY